LLQRKSSIDMHETQYTTIAKLIRRLAKKVNGGHALRLFERVKRSRDARTRWAPRVDGPAKNIRADTDVELRCRRRRSRRPSAICKTAGERTASASRRRRFAFGQRDFQIIANTLSSSWPAARPRLA
jgi:hypothetical protein